MPIRLPADPEYDLAEVRAEDRTEELVAEQRFLQRETDPDLDWFAVVVLALVTVLALGWIGSFALAALWVSRRGRPGKDEPRVGTTIGTSVPAAHRRPVGATGR